GSLVEDVGKATGRRLSMSDPRSIEPPAGPLQRRRQFMTGAALAAVAAAAATDPIPETVPAVVRCSNYATPLKDVAGKVAFITGGSSGIGLGIARAFAQAGMKIVIGYRTQQHVDEALTYFAKPEGQIHAIRVDVT